MSVADLFDTLDYGPAPESPATANAWLDSHQRQFDLFINNQWQTPADSAYMPVQNPATGQPLAQVAVGG